MACTSITPSQIFFIPAIKKYAKKRQKIKSKEKAKSAFLRPICTMPLFYNLDSTQDKFRLPIKYILWILLPSLCSYRLYMNDKAGFIFVHLYQNSGSKKTQIYVKTQPIFGETQLFFQENSGF